MKIVKYLVAALLIVSVTKKVHVQAQSLKLTSADTPMFSFDISTSDMAQVSGTYDQKSKTAQVTFTDVTEYNRSVTPPNIDNPNLIKFGSMPTTALFQDSPKPGGLSATTTLWGITQTQPSKQPLFAKLSTKQDKPKAQILNYDKAGRIIYMNDGTTYVAVEENIPFDATIPKALQAIPSSQNLYGIAVTGETVTVKPATGSDSGYFWPSNKIVQLKNGQTFVEIITEQKGNYKKVGAHALGPVWTRFDEKTLLNSYGISTNQANFKNLVTTIGTIKQGKKTFTLYGVLLKPTTSLNVASPSKGLTATAPITKETEIPNLDRQMSQARQATLLRSLTNREPEAIPLSHAGFTPGFHG